MALENEILSKLKGLSPKVVPCIPAVVKSVEGLFSCTVVLPDGIELAGVRLRAAYNEDATEFVRFKPRPKSTVLISLIGEEESAGEYYVASYTEVDEVTVKVDKSVIVANKNLISSEVQDTKILINKDNAIITVGAEGSQSKITMSNTSVVIEPKIWFTVKNAQANLGSILQDIAVTLRDISIVTPTGVGTLRPDLIAKMTLAVTKLNNLLN